MVKAEKSKKSEKEREDKPKKKSKKEKAESKNGVSKKASKKKDVAAEMVNDTTVAQLADAEVVKAPKRERKDENAGKKSKKPKVESEVPSEALAVPDEKKVRRPATNCVAMPPTRGWTQKPAT